MDREEIRNGKTLQLTNVKSDTTIIELKQRIIEHNKNYWFNEKSSLLYAGHVLDRENHTLKDYKIGPNCNLAFAHWYKFSPPLSLYKLKLFKKAFNAYDADSSGEIDGKELFVLVNELGMSRSRSQCKEMVSKVDADGSGEIDFEEFCTMMVECMQEDGNVFAALESCGVLEEEEQRDRDSGALVMWDVGYPGMNDIGKKGASAYGAVVFDAKTNSYTFA